jgi:hypothetical protein
MRRRLIAVVIAAAISFPLGALLVAPVHADVPWTNITPGGPSPGPSRDFGFAYDQPDDRIVYCGVSGTWFLSFTPAPSWVNVGPVLPNNGDVHAFYDSAGNQVIAIDNQMHVSTLDMTNPAGWLGMNLPPGPPARGYFAAAFDDLHHRLIVFGGGPSPGLFNDVWVLSLSPSPAWAQIVADGTPPAPRWAPIAVYDPSADRLVVGTGSISGGYSTTHDFWSLSLSGTPTWTQLPNNGTVPPNRMLASAVYEPIGQTLVLFGGFDGTGLSDTYQLNLTGPPVWAAVATGGTHPGGRWSTTPVYRLEGGQVVLFGGSTGSVNLNDLWALQTGPVIAPPSISALVPKGGRVGDPVTVTGYALSTATQVTFNGISAPILSASVGSLNTQVPVGATTGPVSVTTNYGTATTADSFYVGETPDVQSFTPSSGRYGASIVIQGSHFARALRVAFGAASNARFTQVSDNEIDAIVDTAAVTGPVTVTTLAAAGTGSAIFTVLPPDTSGTIVSVTDVPDDQGGFVSVRWTGSTLDIPRRRVVTGYRVWRRAIPVGTAETTARLHPEWLQRAAANGDISFWESMATIPAAYLSGYAYTSPTTQDSIAGSNPLTAFFIQALTADPFVFYDSAPDSGYSVDNLAPPMPSPFAASYAPAENDLHWGTSRAGDFREFRLYRGAIPNFATDAGNLVVATRDTGYVDIPGAYYYKLIAYDLHGNASRVAEVTPTSPTAALASLVSVDPQADRIRLTWYSGGNADLGATVYRRTLETGWAPVAQVVADGDGYLRYEDDAVAPGVRYGYRLGIMDAGVEVFAGETWTSAQRLALRLEGVVPNPSSAGRFVVQFTLPDAQPATLELFDVTGRRVTASEVGSMGAGRHTFDVGASIRLSPGVYLVRIKRSGETQTIRAAVLN